MSTTATRDSYQTVMISANAATGGYCSPNLCTDLTIPTAPAGNGIVLDGTARIRTLRIGGRGLREGAPSKRLPAETQRSEVGGHTCAGGIGNISCTFHYYVDGLLHVRFGARVDLHPSSSIGNSVCGGTTDLVRRWGEHRKEECARTTAGAGRCRPHGVLYVPEAYSRADPVCHVPAMSAHVPPSGKVLMSTKWRWPAPEQPRAIAASRPCAALEAWT